MSTTPSDPADRPQPTQPLPADHGQPTGQPIAAEHSTQSEHATQAQPGPQAEQPAQAQQPVQPIQQQPAYGPPPPPVRRHRSVSVLVTSLVGAGTLVVGGVAGFAIGHAGDHDRPGYSRQVEGRGGPGMNRGGPGQHRVPVNPGRRGGQPRNNQQPGNQQPGNQQPGNQGNQQPKPSPTPQPSPSTAPTTTTG
ncbi:hypothetical protein [Actinokineospora inagensis]|uniref:hypothetical protein n=1 Tax=Actinokineospora inagensis TaxID=103730 RepID=UPI00042A62CD|nr:hypothetical protein [Actinokineospora inagensis]